MQPSWQAHPPEARPVPATAEGPVGSEPKDSYFTEPLADLERQLAAELSGAAWGVVAFAPEDGLWCDWIYRNLNGYRLPHSLVERITPHGFPRPDCLSIFPDRRDPAYEAQYPQALREGVYLIIICSPDTGKTTKAEETIRMFKESGGNERIIVLVVDGPPDFQLGERLRSQECDWLPAWLRGRLESEGFKTADRSEPRVVDGRRGYRSLTQVRDGLLTALVDMDASEFERLGGCNRPVDSVLLAHPTSAGDASEMTTAVAIQPTSSTLTATRRGGSKYTILMAVALIVVAVVFGFRSFKEITSDEPVSTLVVGPVTGVLAGHSKEKTGDDTTADQDPVVPTETASALISTTSTPEPSVTGEDSVAAARTSQPTVTAAAAVQVSQTAPAPAPSLVVSKVSVASMPGQSSAPNVAQVSPAQIYPTSHIVSSSVAATEHVSAPPAPSSASVPNPESDSVLLDEVNTLVRRGDETMAEKHTEDALDLYNNALQGAQEYALRKSATPQARDQVVALMCKLAILELQNSSTAEAKATFIRARKALLQEKNQGQWNRERAKMLDQIESRIQHLTTSD
jgi:hypothetical protein